MTQQQRVDEATWEGDDAVALARADESYNAEMKGLEDTLRDWSTELYQEAEARAREVGKELVV